MMTKCPECGSKEIIPDLIHLAAVSASHGPLYVSLVDPAKKGERVGAGFRVAMCGACGHTEMYTQHFQKVHEAHQKGYVTEKLY